MADNLMGDVPLDFQPQMQNISQQQKLSQMLLQQAQQQPQGQMVSGRYVAPALTQYLTPLFSAYAGSKGMETAEQKQLDLAKAVRQIGGEEVKNILETSKKDPYEAMRLASNAQTPQAKSLLPTLAKALELSPEERKYKAAVADGSWNPEKMGGFNAFMNQMSEKDKAALAIDRQRLAIAQNTFALDYGIPAQGNGLPQGGVMPQGNRMPQGGIQTVAPGSPILANPNMPSYAQGTPVAGINTAPVNTSGLLPKDVRGIQAGLAKDTAEAQQAKITSALNMAPAIKEIEKLLPNSTSGGAKTLLKEGYEFTTGKPTTKSGVDAQLGVLGAKLIAEVPRFKGADSDKDVAQYKAAAGDVANTNKPWQSRMAALQIIKDLNVKYAPDVYKDMMTPAEAAPPPTEAPRTSLSNTWQIINRKQ